MVEIFLVIFWLAQVGQETSPILLVFNTSFSNGLPQSAQTYSKMGIYFSENRISRGKVNKIGSHAHWRLESRY
jgi:hypothetical protein